MPPTKKSATVLTSKKAIQNAMTLTCEGDHDHCALEGNVRGYGPRTRYMEEYQPALASTLAAAISLDEPPQLWEKGYASTEQREVTPTLVKRADTRQQAVRIVQKLHRNLGHPSTKELTELLQTRGASEEILKVAQSYVCTACAKYKKPADAAPASLPQSTTGRQRVIIFQSSSLLHVYLFLFTVFGSVWTSSATFNLFVTSPTWSTVPGLYQRSTLPPDPFSHFAFFHTSFLQDHPRLQSRFPHALHSRLPSL